MHITCPKCSAGIEPEENRAFVRCSYCNNVIFIDLDDCTSVFTFKPVIQDRDVAMYLKKDFKRTGFNSKFRINSVTPVYIPFWKPEGKNGFLRASSKFSSDIEESISVKPQFFNPEAEDLNAEIWEIDTQPEDTEERVLFYIPFYRVEVIYRNSAHVFFINSTNGAVEGEPLNVFSSKEVTRMFPLFITIITGVIFLNIFLKNNLLLFIVDIIAYYIAYQFSTAFLTKSTEEKKSES